MKKYRPNQFNTQHKSSKNKNTAPVITKDDLNKDIMNERQLGKDVEPLSKIDRALQGYLDIHEPKISALINKGQKNPTFTKKREGKAIWHYERVSIEAYIEILYDTYLKNMRDNASYEYKGTAYCKKYILSRI